MDHLNHRARSRLYRGARRRGTRLAVAKLPEAKRGFAPLPRRWVIERGFAWTGRFRRRAGDDERLPTTSEDLHHVAFALFVPRAVRPALDVL